MPKKDKKESGAVINQNSSDKNKIVIGFEASFEGMPGKWFSELLIIFSYSKRHNLNRKRILWW